MTIDVLKANDLTETLQRQVSDLYRQLNADNKQRSLNEILAPGNNVLVIICKIENTIVGTALLSTYKVISGYRGMIDDVVVDAAHRGKGIGRKLMERLLNEAKNMDLDEILLFTGHHRKPAKALYESLGFELRNSGLYNLKIH
jgi:phosphinothricin acetyltransferase